MFQNLIGMLGSIEKNAEEIQRTLFQNLIGMLGSVEDFLKEEFYERCFKTL